MKNGWQKVKLGEVLTMRERFEPRDELAEYSFAGTYSFARGIFVGQTKNGSAFKLPRIQRIRAGDFIYCKIMAWEGAFGIAPKEADNCVMSGTFVAYELDRKRIDEKFLDYFFKVPAHWQNIGGQSTGTNVRRQSLHPAQFESAQIPLPPLSEQRRVVARIDELVAQVHEARTLRHQAAEEAEALRSARRNRFFVSAAQKYGAARLEELSSRITKGESPAWQGFTYQDTGPMFIRSENVLWGKLDARNAVRIPRVFHEKLSRCQLRKDDVLINLVGASIGRACAVPENLGDANVNQAVGVISAITKRLLPDYLVHFLLSPIAQDEIHGGKVETARPNISLVDVRDLEIPTPPLPEQQRIVAELDALQAEVDALERIQDETSKELDALRPSILDKAFRGELV